MKQYKTYILLATMLGLTVGCSTDKEMGFTQNEVELHFSATTISSAPFTRAGAADAYNDALPAGSDIGVYIYGYLGSDSWDISTLQPTNGTTSKTWIYRTVGEAVQVDATSKVSNLTLTSHSSAPKFPARPSDNQDMDRVEITAIFPNNTSFTPSSTPDYYQFIAELDQTTVANIKKSDLLTNDKVAYTKTQCEGQSLQLNLKHRMAKLHVTFVPKTGSDLTTANMPTAFDVQNVFRAVKITPKAGTVTRDETVEKTTSTAPLKAVTEHSFFIAPQEIAASTTLLKFDIKGSGKFKGIEGCTFAPSAKVTFDAGKSYEITVTVDVDFASITGTITTWNTETMSYDTVVL